MYTERVEQGLKKPCFFVCCDNYSDELYRGKRYRRQAVVKIEFMDNDDSESINYDRYNVIENLYDITEVIEGDEGSLRGYERKWEKSEKGFIFYVKYEYFYYVKEENAFMERLSIEENAFMEKLNIKEGEENGSKKKC
ncbi:MAG: hypothetical protein Q4F63_02900 [Clostridia bacterium]|nr:hypothetical protein [Clostridia bacterium]